MCGIVGLISKDDVVDRLLGGLKRLEYRGYDSAGIATVNKDVLGRRRAEGKLAALEGICKENSLNGSIGIGHTRWATHGPAIEVNAHPHANHRIALVHNGIIENYSDLKSDLQTRHTFLSQTDTEVIVYLIEDALLEGLSPLHAVQNAMKKLKGAYALAILFKDSPHTLYAVRQGSPLVVGMSEEEGMSLGSDAITLAPLAHQLCYLEDGDVAELTLDTINIYDRQDKIVTRPFVKNPVNIETIGKGQYRHYMLKEIFEQPTVLGHGLQHVLAHDADHLHMPNVNIPFNEVHRISIIACGTSYYAAMVAKYWFEAFARIQVDVDIASEFRYRSPVFTSNHYCFFISQSGETSDTLAAMELARHHSTTVGVVNVPESSMARMADHVVFTHAGPEIGVASTKAFTCQLLCLLTLALEAARQRGHLSAEDEKHLIQGLRTLPAMTHQVLQNDTIQSLSQKIMNAGHVIFLGRGSIYPIALEGALKLKEITYIPSDAYPSGELKHGPIALIDENVPVLVIAPYDQWFEKSASNIQEIHARKGKLIVFTDAPGAAHLTTMLPNVFHPGQNLIILPQINQALQPFLYVLPLQLLAYYTGVHKGTDVDQPRNLAKSVTVE
ncbi:MAG: glutamine--fructose-6-phosphate transaminase (isomerizing) [Alphaproteobacteria bacterium]|nr:glutamine--fructose-6-phosphate transaminase (isomerizing) [Alphaproteobacteria bacterium]